MAIQEIKIGIALGLSNGIFTNTEYRDNKLQLANIGFDGDGNTIYASKGEWESDTILIKDKIESFKNVVKTTIDTGTASTKVYTKSSDDGFIWTEYVEVGVGGSIVSPVKKYARIKVEIFAGVSDANFYVDNFNTPDKYTNSYINSSDGVLELKKNYTYTMSKIKQDTEGITFSKLIPNSKLKKINSIKLLERE